jgi:hypothetical protein
MVALEGLEHMIQQSLSNPRKIKYVRNSSKSISASVIKERSRPFLNSGCNGTERVTADPSFLITA